MKTRPIKNHLIVTLICVAILSCVQDNDFSVPNSLGDEENKNLKTLLDRVDAGYIQLCLRDSRLPFILTLLTLSFVYERLLITDLNLFQRPYY